MKTAKLFFFLLIVISPFQSSAWWGYKGHQLVAELAMRQLSDATRQKVLKVLGTMSVDQAATWMDEVRNFPTLKYMAPWHYTNIDSGQVYKAAANGDILTALNKAYNELQHIDTLNLDQVRFDVLVLIHLCGDLTQPLHVGYGSDKGGRDYQVQYNGKGTNLYHIWDSEIIESQHIDLASLAFKTPPPNEGKINNEVEKLKKIQIDFMHQLVISRNSLPLVYSLKGHKIDEVYMQQAGDLVKQQLQQGACLLAACLEQLFYKVDKLPEPAPEPQRKPEPSKTTVTQELLEKIPGAAAAGQIGKRACICDQVIGAKFLGGNGVTFLNMGGVYPNNPFTAVIMFKDRANFPYKPEEYLVNKKICVIGSVIEYKGKPEIIVEKPEQIIMQ